MTGPGVRIDEVDPSSDDAVWCLEQYYAELAELFEEGFDASKSLLADPNDMRRPYGVFLILRVDERPVACGVVKVSDPGVAYIKRMWVQPDHRGQGLARVMLAALEAAALELGCMVAELETNRVLTGAIRLYLSSGYQEVAPFNDEFYAHHWFRKVLRESDGGDMLPS